MTRIIYRILYMPTLKFSIALGQPLYYILLANVRNYPLTKSVQIVIRENSQVPCQMWSFANRYEDLEDAQHTADQISQVLQAQIDQAERDEEEADRKNLQLIRYMCEKVSWLLALIDLFDFKDMGIRSAIGSHSAAHSVLLPSRCPPSYVGL